MMKAKIPIIAASMNQVSDANLAIACQRAGILPSISFLNFIDNKSHIVPIMVNNPLRCKEISNILLNEFKHYIQPINYPTVPVGTERLRVTPGPLHTEKMISDLTIALKYAFKKTEKDNYSKIA